MTIDRVYQTIDAHTAGEPLRIVVSGVPPIPGATMLEKRQYFRDHCDDIRRTLMLEPRGHDDMYGCVLTEPVTDGADMGVLFMHNEGYSSMCGHGIIALVTVAVENGIVRHPSDIKIDSPAGLIRARAEFDGKRVKSVTFQNVPSFVFASDLRFGELLFDIVFGGAFYALMESPVPIDGAHLPELRELGMRIKHDIERTRDVEHPLEPALRGIYGTIFTSQARQVHCDRRNVTIFADGEVDRSPCGTGTCGVLASRFARRRITENQDFFHESIIGTVFSGRVIGQTKVGPFDAVIPEITGSAHVTGYHTFVVSADDPVAAGFRVSNPVKL
jgi:proline racemase